MAKTQSTVTVPVDPVDLPALELLPAGTEHPPGYAGVSRSQSVVKYFRRRLRLGESLSEYTSVTFTRAEIAAYSSIGLDSVAAASWARFGFTVPETKRWRDAGIRQAVLAAELEDRYLTPADYARFSSRYRGGQSAAQALAGTSSMRRTKKITDAEADALASIGVTRREGYRLRADYTVPEILAAETEGLLPYLLADWHIGTARELRDGGFTPEQAAEVYDDGVTDTDALLSVLRGEMPREWAKAFSEAEIVEPRFLGFRAA